MKGLICCCVCFVICFGGLFIYLFNFLTERKLFASDVPEVLCYFCLMLQITTRANCEEVCEGINNKKSRGFNKM